MKLGNIRIYIIILIIFLGNMVIAIAVDKIESVPLINLEELVPTFEEDKDVMEDKYEQNDSLNDNQNYNEEKLSKKRCLITIITRINLIIKVSFIFLLLKSNSRSWSIGSFHKGCRGHYQFQ